MCGVGLSVFAFLVAGSLAVSGEPSPQGPLARGGGMKTLATRRADTKSGEVVLTIAIGDEIELTNKRYQPVRFFELRSMEKNGRTGVERVVWRDVLASDAPAPAGRITGDVLLDPATGNFAICLARGDRFWLTLLDANVAPQLDAPPNRPLTARESDHLLQSLPGLKNPTFAPTFPAESVRWQEPQIQASTIENVELRRAGDNILVSLRIAGKESPVVFCYSAAEKKWATVSQGAPTTGKRGQRRINPGHNISY